MIALYRAAFFSRDSAVADPPSGKLVRSHQCHVTLLTSVLAKVDARPVVSSYLLSGHFAACGDHGYDLCCLTRKRKTGLNKR